MNRTDRITYLQRSYYVTLMEAILLFRANNFATESAPISGLIKLGSEVYLLSNNRYHIRSELFDVRCLDEMLTT